MYAHTLPYTYTSTHPYTNTHTQLGERIKTLRHTQVGVAAGSQQYVGWLATGALVRQKLGIAGLYRGTLNY